MTYTARPEAAGRMSDTTWHVITAILAVAGIVAAAIGWLIGYGPDDGTLTLFDWTWNFAAIDTAWVPILMIGGGGLAALTMGIESMRDWSAEHSAFIIGLEAFVALVGLAAVVVGIVFLF